MNYSSQEDYKAKIANSGKWRTANDYEVFAFNFCMECRYFKADKDAGSVCSGDCSLMEQEGAYNGVIATAVCNRYVNTRGFDINGKVVDPAALPKWIPTRTDKRTGETFIVA
ncbi:hypothetical protein AGMMS50230_18680 [Spirochaetia bacterium]|nr:hypothetical protein AGMMS50230_18680 [Spirochaetia bacterium]